MAMHLCLNTAEVGQTDLASRYSLDSGAGRARMTANEMSLRNLLRKQTEQLHAELDAVIGNLLATGQQDYPRLLTLHAAVVLPLESRLQAACKDWLPRDWDRRLRSKALRADLAVLGISDWPSADVSYDIDGANSLGVVYVLEGSRLGARFILKEVDRPSATAFLRHGEGELEWSDVVSWLDGIEITDTEREQAVTAAISTFRLYLTTARCIADRQEEVPNDDRREYRT